MSWSFPIGRTLSRTSPQSQYNRAVRHSTIGAIRRAPERHAARPPARVGEDVGGGSHVEDFGGLPQEARLLGAAPSGSGVDRFPAFLCHSAAF